MSRDEQLDAQGVESDIDPEIQALEEELRRANDELTAVTDQRDRAGRAALLREEIELARQKKAEAEALAEAEKRYGPIGAKRPKIARVDIDGVGMFIVREPEPIKVKRFYEKVQSDETMSLDETFEVARPYIVYPPKERADQLYGERPLIATPLSNACLKLGGLALKKASGK